MKKPLFLLSFILLLFSCENKAKTTESVIITEDTIPVVQSEELQFHDVTNKKNCFIIISKKDLNLRVYEALATDTVLIAKYPVCVGKNLGNKTKKGDMKTPETTLDKPFTITEIKDASTWTHDFGDGRGSILSYGHWFMRLSYGSGIGIHGSTNNESSVPGRASEGCIRLRDEDIIKLKENYAFVGMKVIVKAENEGLWSFEE